MKRVDVNEIINNSKFNKFHLSLLICFMFIAICDGYDMYYLGNIIPTLIEEWNISTVTAGILTSYGLFGMMLGSLILGTLSDKLGRKITIFISVFVFSAFTLLAGFSNNPTTFGILRFIAGLGVGGVLPILVASLTEYAPKNKRMTLVTFMNTGATLGGVLTSVAAMYIIPHFGWKPVVWLGALPLLFLPLFLKLIPDSPAYYYRKKQKEQLANILNKVVDENRFTTNDEFILIVDKRKGSSVRKLFTDKRTLSTFMFWIIVFMNLMIMYGLGTWIPKIMQTAGYSLVSSISFLLILKAGGIFGAIGGGSLSDKFGAKNILFPYYATACLSIFVLGFQPSMSLSYLLLFLAGAATSGAQMIANAYISQYYPTEMRSTGIGWSLGIGRLGAILGPILGGVVLGANTPYAVNFLVFIIPCLIAAIALLFVQEKYGNKSTDTDIAGCLTFGTKKLLNEDK